MYEKRIWQRDRRRPFIVWCEFTLRDTIVDALIEIDPRTAFLLDEGGRENPFRPCAGIGCYKDESGDVHAALCAKAAPLHVGMPYEFRDLGSAERVQSGFSFRRHLVVDGGMKLVQFAPILREIHNAAQVFKLLADRVGVALDQVTFVVDSANEVRFELFQVVIRDSGNSFCTPKIDQDIDVAIKVPSTGLALRINLFLHFVVRKIEPDQVTDKNLVRGKAIDQGLLTVFFDPILPQRLLCACLVILAASRANSALSIIDNPGRAVCEATGFVVAGIAEDEVRVC